MITKEVMMKRNNRYDTRFFEKYAMLSLQYCYRTDWKGFAYGQGVESPDLQCEKLGIGVEVTRAVSRADGLSERIMHAYLHKNQEGQIFGEDSISIENEIATVKALANDFQFKVHLEDLERSIRVKTDKLNRIYKKFAENDLYIFTFRAMEVRDIARVFAETEGEVNAFPIQYDYYFINCLNQIHIKKSGREEITTLKLSSEMLRRLKREAEKV